MALILLWVLILLWGGILIFQDRQLSRAAAERRARFLDIGMEVYGQNCASCHGPVGEGVVGPPLNRAEFRGDPEEKRDTFDMLVSTISRGRLGTPDPTWVRLETGEWASFTAMPAWARSDGGPLDEQHVQAVARFIMEGDWSKAPGNIPPPRMPRSPADLPDAQGLEAAENREAKTLFMSKGCISCHAVGGYGGFVGPDLSKVGSWGVTAEFLDRWIADPPGTPDRAPVYWSIYSGPLLTPVQSAQAPGSTPPREQAQRGEGRGFRRSGVSTTPGGGITFDIEIPKVQPLPPTQMPRIPMSDDERGLLVRYLLGLK